MSQPAPEMLSVEVCLASGKSCSVVLAPTSRVRELKAEAQRQLKRQCLRLAVRGRQLDPRSTLGEVVQEWDIIDAIAQPPKLASTLSAFAIWTTGGRVFTWGHPLSGGNSSRVQEQLVRVQQVRANGDAFAAILDDGSVVTWGHPAFGGDSSRVREQLVRVQRIQATDQAFAAILDGGSVVTWGKPAKYKSS